MSPFSKYFFANLAESFFAMGYFFMPCMLFFALFFALKRNKKVFIAISLNVFLFFVYALFGYVLIVSNIMESGNDGGVAFAGIMAVIFLSFLHIFIFGWWLVFRKQ